MAEEEIINPAVANLFQLKKDQKALVEEVIVPQEVMPELVANKSGPPTLENLKTQFGEEIYNDTVSLEDRRELFRQTVDVRGFIKQGFSPEQIARDLVRKFPRPIDSEPLDYETVFNESGKTADGVIQWIMNEKPTGFIDQSMQSFYRGLLETGSPGFVAARTGIAAFVPTTVAASATGPIAAPIIGGVTAAGIAATTYFGLNKIGTDVAEMLIPAPSDLPMYFPFQEAFEMGGANTPFALAPWSAGRYFAKPGTLTFANNVSKSQRIAKGSGEYLTPLEKMALSSQNNSVATAFFEGSTVFGVSMGTFIAENQDPGNYPLRLGLELISGFVSPVVTAIAANQLKKPVSKLKTVFDYINPLNKTKDAADFALTKQGQWLREKIELSGTDWGLFIKKLNDPETTRLLAEARKEANLPIGDRFRTKTLGGKDLYDGPTVAALTDDPFMIALQSTLAKESPSFKSTVRDNYKDNITGLYNLVRLMEQSGNPELVGKASTMEAALFEALIERNLKTTQERADASVNALIGPTKLKELEAKIDASNPNSLDPTFVIPESNNLGQLQAKAGKVIQQNNINTIIDSRAQEELFYKVVNGQEPILPTNFIESVAYILRTEGEDAADFIPANVLRLYNRAIGKDVEMVAKETGSYNALSEKINKKEIEINDYEVLYQDTAKLINDFDATLNRADLTDESILAAYQAEKARIEGLTNTSEKIKLNKSLLEAKERIKTTRNRLQRKEGEYDFFLPYNGAETRITNTSDKAWSELSLSQKLEAFELEKQGFRRRYFDELERLEINVNSGARSGEVAERDGTGTAFQNALRLEEHKKEGLPLMESQLQRIDDEILLTENAGFEFFSAMPKKRAIKLLEDNIVLLNDRLRFKGLNAARTEAADLGTESVEVLLSDMMNLRSNILEKARNASRGDKWQDAHFLSDLADGIRKDFEVHTTPNNVDPLSANKQALKTANTFSKAFNDVYSRTAIVANTSKTSKGKYAVMPELLFKDINAGGGDATALKYEQLQNAMTFLSDTLGKDFEATDFARLGTMKAAQETMLTFLFEKTVDPITNLVDPSKLARFKRENRNVISMFPLLSEDLNSIETTNALLVNSRENLELGKSLLGRKVRDDDIASFYDFANKENLSGVITTMLGQPGSRPVNPEKQLQIYAQGIKKAVKKAPKKYKGLENGFVSVILDNAFSFSLGPAINGQKPKFNSLAFQESLMKPLVKNGRTVLDVLQKEGIITKFDAARLREITDMMVKFDLEQASLTSSKKEVVPQTLMQRAGAAMKTLATVTSTGIYGLIRDKAGITMSAGGIAVPAAIAKQAQQYLDIPASFSTEIIERAALDPEFFKILTMKTTSAEEKLQFRIAFGNAMYKGGSLRTLTQDQRAEQENKRRRERLLLEEDRIKQMLIKKQGYDIEELKRRARPEATETQEKLRTSFLTRQLEQQPQSGILPPNNFASSASGSGNAGTRFSAMSQGEKYDALFGNSGIGSLMS